MKGFADVGVGEMGDVTPVMRYAYLVPYVEEEEHFFLKTVIPSRKATRDFLKTGEPDA